TQKFGHGYCIYCTKCPCECSKKRGVKPPPPPRIEVRNWTFPEAIAEIGKIYGPKNRVDGIAYLADRLREEFSEVTDVLLLDIHKPGIKTSTHWWNLACEVADVYSVICAIADVEELDIDTEFQNRYGGVHPRCGCRPCECGPFYQYMADHADTVTT
ncbi:MAG TPA: hypothetical protein VK145_01110, partial [Candidatus Nanoarchaeia archaeon]|nr:hypothetical protein [Candidatus Nanoarchaeia archaeon]